MGCSKAPNTGTPFSKPSNFTFYSEGAGPTTTGPYLNGGVGLESSAPVRFPNLRPWETPQPAQIFSNDVLGTVAQRRLGYVVLDDGAETLVTGKLNAFQGHIDLAGGKPVLAAGEFGVYNGELKYIDNFSGHYQPWGPRAQGYAENAFRRLGFNVDGKYQPYEF